MTREKKKEGTMYRAPTFSYTPGTCGREQQSSGEKNSGHENRGKRRGKRS